MRSRDYKKIALDGLTGKWFIAFVASLIASIFGVGGGVSVDIEFGNEEVNPEPIVDFVTENIIPVLIVAAISSVVYLLVMLMISSIVSVGYAQFNVDLITGVEPKIKTLFSHTRQWKTTFCANVLVFLRVLIGCILFVVPGIIAAYKYSMVNHVLADNPNFTPREALRHSAEIMQGNKWRLFCLHLSFFGWMILSVLTFGIALAWVYPYQQATMAAFYEDIKY